MTPEHGVTVRVEACAKTFADGTRALEPVTLDIARGETVVLLGPSGCGKTTMLRIVAGLMQPDAGGRVLFGDADVTRVPIERRNVGMVFQSYALFPNMTVGENIGYGLKIRGLGAAERKARVAELVALTGIEGLEQRRVDQLSGGQRQRVALGRAIVRDPKVFLFDEPLSNLDAKLRVSTRVEIRKLQKELGTTSVYVTHDQLEAMTLADMLVVMNAGRVEQIGAPLEVYEKPATTFVATFIGAPAMNLLKMEGAEPGLLLGNGRLPPEGAIVGIRPEDLELTKAGATPDGGIAFPLTVGAVERVGPESFVYGTLDRGDNIIVRTPGTVAPAPGERAVALASRAKLHVFSADGSRRI